ncbi:Mut7-C RNAse domain-containing protein [Candidatus Margulisiibacteriota bacterium]
MKKAEFRFYEELNDFLTSDKRKNTFSYEFTGTPSIKDAIEAIGVPHTEVDLVLVNQKSVTFEYLLQDKDIVSVYPVFESLDISEATHLRPKPLREPKFVLDVHLGKLAKYLRMFGFDTLYETTYSDPEIIKIAKNQKRIILTRDMGILKNKLVTHGYWLRSQNPKLQLKEVLVRFDLLALVQPFTRCLECNGDIAKTDRDKIIDKLPDDLDKQYTEFFECLGCQKVYWKGSHYDQMQEFMRIVQGT